jgi:hypothetical protein
MLIILYFLISCKSAIKNNDKKYLAYLNDTTDLLPDDYLEKLRKSSYHVNMDSIRANTSDFYDIEIVSKPNKKIFNLEEQKFFSFKITNYGNKELFLPEWFRIDNGYINNNNIEMTIEIYKKRKVRYEKYVQKRITTQTFVHPSINLPKRAILITNNGKKISYSDISVDLYKKIVDEGSYKAKIYIDLSNFGYFKIIETEIFFDVKD